MDAQQTSFEQLEQIARLVRYYILNATTRAGSGHPTSSLSGVELMVALLFGNIFRYRAAQPDHPNNDRLIFSKGHASPLLYALWTAAGELSEEELMTYRRFDSRLEGHPSIRLPYVEAMTGSLGQGLSIGFGMALNAGIEKLPYRTYVLLGDSEMAEGSQWEAIQLAAYYRLDNLVGILDVNRLGQRGETMLGHDLEAYRRRIEAFGWNTVIVDGHDLQGIIEAYHRISQVTGQPSMIIAKTLKGKGVSFIEDRNGYHGTALKEKDLQRALQELGEVDRSVRGRIALPDDLQEETRKTAPVVDKVAYSIGDMVATRDAFGYALKRIYPAFPDIVSLDGEVGNSTRAEIFQAGYPDRFFEMFIAEQNMVGAALGLARRGKIPFVSTFAAFMSRAYDQIRMCQYSDANIKFVGSHAGVSIGEDGPSQMGLEDLAFFRTLADCLVLYPCDAVSTEKMVAEGAEYRGLAYIRTTRQGTPVIYEPEEEFPAGGCKVLRSSTSDRATLVAAGITVHEALAAHEELNTMGISVGVIDLYSIKPVDAKTLKTVALETGLIITIEDHYPEGGLGDAVRGALWDSWLPVFSLAVTKRPKSGKPRELLDFEGISAQAIVRKVLEFVH